MVFLQKFFADLFVNLTPARGISIVIDVALTSLLFYAVLRLISNTRALQLAQGLVIYYLLVFGVEWLSLKAGLLALNSVFSWLRSFSADAWSTGKQQARVVGHAHSVHGRSRLGRVRR
jgi:DNA integrity scanning protein DisA with diadenylate cyclase activity